MAVTKPILSRFRNRLQPDLNIIISDGSGPMVQKGESVPLFIIMVQLSLMERNLIVHSVIGTTFKVPVGTGQVLGWEEALLLFQERN